MRVDLVRHWAEGRRPRRDSGRAMLAVRRDRVELGWDVALESAPRAPAGPPAFTEGLWEHDVVEVFLRGEDPRRYVEIEAGVAGHWLALAFRDVRARERELRDLRVLALSDVVEGRWRGRVEVDASGVEAVIGRRPWHALVAAVTGDPAEGPRVHLAWPRLPGKRPDFHQPAAWALLTD